MLFDLVKDRRGVSGGTAVLEESGERPARNPEEVVVALPLHQPRHADEGQEDHQPDGGGQDRQLKEGHSPDQRLCLAHDADNL
jgi:hypothetical protein